MDVAAGQWQCEWPEESKRWDKLFEELVDLTLAVSESFPLVFQLLSP